jgi:hypothetical protein
MKVNAASMGTRPLRCITVSGSPRQRGRAIGEEWRVLIANYFAVWQQNLEGCATTPSNALDYFNRFMAAGSHEQAARRWTPALVEEVEGLAEGAGLSMQQAFGLQLIDEEWNYAQDMATARPRRLIDKCTALAVANEQGDTVLAQNVDIPRWSDGFQVAVRHLYDDGSEILVVTLPGLIAASGVNSASIGVCVNSVMQLPASRYGLPVAFVVRGVLEQRSISDAERFIRRVEHASGQNYLIASVASMACFEGCAAGVAHVPAFRPGRMFHTNHVQANWTASLPMTPQSATSDGSSAARLAAVERRLGDVDLSSGMLEGVKAALSSCDDPANPVCRHGDADPRGLASFTAWSVLYQWNAGSGTRPTVHLCPGPPDERGYDHVLIGRAG